MGVSISKTKVLSDQQIQRMVQQPIYSVADAENIKMPESLTLEQTAKFLTEKTELITLARKREDAQLLNIAKTSNSLLRELRAAFFDKLILTAYQESRMSSAKSGGDTWLEFYESLVVYYRTHPPASMKFIDDQINSKNPEVILRYEHSHPKMLGYAQSKMIKWTTQYKYGNHFWTRPEPVVDKTDHDRVAASLQPDIVPNAPPPDYA